jgi:D-galactarolactone isomerase
MQWPLPTRKPKLVAPPGACDTHIHFFDAKYPKHPDGPTPAPDAPVGDYRKLQEILGTQRVIVVQANAYGDDNRLTMDGVAALGLDKARAVVVVKPGVSDAEMERLTKAGARAVRFMCVPGGHLKWDVMDEVIARVRPFGWHCTVQFDGRDFVQHEAQLTRIKGDYIIDHAGKFLEPVVPDHDAFKVLLRLVGRGNCYVKLAGAYETSKTGKPDYADVARLAKELIKAAPERMIWASNWPHNSATPETHPDESNMLDLLSDWMPDEATRRKTLVENPARLYGF